MWFFAGPRLGLWVVIPCQLIVMIGLDIVYCVTAGKAMYYVYQHTCNGFQTHTCTSFGLSAWIVLFAIIQMILSMVGTGSTVLAITHALVTYDMTHMYVASNNEAVCSCVDSYCNSHSRLVKTTSSYVKISLL